MAIPVLKYGLDHNGQVLQNQFQQNHQFGNSVRDKYLDSLENQIIQFWLEHSGEQGQQSTPQDSAKTILSRFLEGHGDASGSNLLDSIAWYNDDAGGNLQGMDAKGYASLLAMFKNDPTLSQALQNYLNGNNYFPGSSDAFQNLLQTYMSQAATKEERQYNSPVAQLSRLMAAGMSREAALQAISSQQSATTTIPQMIPSSQSAFSSAQNRSSGIQNALGQFSSLMQAAQLFVGIADFGLKVPTQVAQNALNEVTAKEAAKVQQGEQAAGMITNAVAGMEIPEDVWQSPESLKKWLSKSEDPVLQQTLNHPLVHTAWNNNQTWDALYRAYNRNVSARGAKELESQATWRLKQWQAQSMLSQLQYDQSFLDYQWSELKFGDYMNTRDILNDYNLTSWTANLALISAETTPELMQKRIEALRNDYSFVATTAWFKSHQAEFMQGKYNNDPQVRKALQTCWLIDALGITDGLIGNSIRGAAGLPILSENLKSPDGAVGGTLQQIWDLVNESGAAGWNMVDTATKQLAELFKLLGKKTVGVASQVGAIHSSGLK